MTNSGTMIVLALIASGCREKALPPRSLDPVQQYSAPLLVLGSHNAPSVTAEIRVPAGYDMQQFGNAAQFDHRLGPRIEMLSLGTDDLWKQASTFVQQDCKPLHEAKLVSRESRPDGWVVVCNAVFRRGNPLQGTQKVITQTNVIRNLTWGGQDFQCAVRFGRRASPSEIRDAITVCNTMQIRPRHEPPRGDASRTGDPL